MLFASKENGCRCKTGFCKWLERHVKRRTVSDKPIDGNRVRGALLTNFSQRHELVRDMLRISLKKSSKNSCINNCLMFGIVKQVLRSSNHKIWRLLHLHLQYCASSKKNKPELTGHLKLILWSFNHWRKQRLEMRSTLLLLLFLLQSFPKCYWQVVWSLRLWNKSERAQFVRHNS